MLLRTDRSRRLSSRLSSHFNNRKPRQSRRQNANRGSQGVRIMESLESRVLLAADFGDALASYGTLLADNGARHEIVAGGPTLGLSVDAETDGIPSSNAAGDDVSNLPLDDENGVQFTGPIIVGAASATVTVTVENAPNGAKLDAWVDFNADGTFDAGDQIADSVTVSEGVNIVTFSVPSIAAAGNTFARFRLSTVGDLGPTGAAADGEVEDYHVTITDSASPADVGTLDTQHYIPPFYAVSGLGSSFIGNQYLSLSTPETGLIEVNITNASGTVNETVRISKSTPALINLSAAPYGGAFYDGLGIVDDNGLNQVNASDGLILTSTQPFYANSRQISSAQGDALTAKGQSALGTRFRAGFLNTLTTADTGDSFRGHFISVMASEDGTTVNFSNVGPGIYFRDGSGTLTGTPGPVTLNRGESYVIGVRLSDISAADQNNLNGTLITSDKPVAVNTGSWTAGNGSGQDVGFDQLLPTNLLGTRYILAKGSATTEAINLETPIVVADTDNTQIYLNGSPLPIATINAGDFYIIPGTHYSTVGTMVIETSEPAYVYQSTAGTDSAANVGMNFAIAVSDALLPQEVVIGNVDQMGTATVKIVAPVGAPVTYNGTVLSGAQPIPGASDFEIYSVTGSTGTVTINSPKPLFISVVTISGLRTGAAYFSGAPNTVAVDDVAGTSFDTAVNIDVQDNDSAGPAFTLQSATDPANGSIFINPDGTITYTPDSGFIGIDSFDYTISDGFETDSASVIVTIGPNTFDFTTGAYSRVEGDVTSTTNVVQVQRRGDLSAANSIGVNLFAGAGNPATPGVDFTSGPITVSFAPGQAVQSVPIEILGETVVEPNEIISLSLFGDGVGIIHPTATLTLVDDDANLPPVIDADLAAVTISEGNIATNSGTFSDAELDPLTLTASIGTVVDTGSGTWAWSFNSSDGPGQSQTVTITVYDDKGGFGSVNFPLTITNVAPKGSLANDGPILVGDSATVSFNGQADPSTTDTIAGFRYAFDFDNNGTFEIGDGTFSGSVTSSTAVIPTDVLAAVGDHTVRGRIIDKDGGANDYTTTITVEPRNVAPVLNDQFFSLDENSADGTVVGIAVASDADLPGDTLTWSIIDGNTSGAFAIDSASGEITVADWEALDFETTPSFSLLVMVEDSYGETGTATVTVDLNDLQSTLSVSGDLVIEGGLLEFTFTLSSTVAHDTVISYSTADGEADSSDYTAATGTITIPAGQISGTVIVETTADKVVETDEYLSLSITDVSGTNDVSVITGFGYGTILNDDIAVVSIGTVKAPETDSTTTFSFLVTLSNPVAGDVRVRISTEDGSALADDDYVPLQGLIVTIPAGSLSVPVEVTVLGDRTVEANEDFFVHVGAVRVVDGGGTPKSRIRDVFANPNPGIGTIVNDDTALVSISSVSASETDADTAFAFRVILSNPVDESVQVWVRTEDDLAVAGDDYEPLKGYTITVPAGAKSAPFEVIVHGDNVAEPRETFFAYVGKVATLNNGVVMMVPNRDVVASTNPGVGTIVNDDAAPVADAGKAYAISEGDGLSLDASRSKDADDGFSALTFRWDIDGDGDYDELVLGATPTLTAARLAALGLNDDATVTVTVKVSDGTNVDTATTTLTVKNVAPKFSADTDETLLPPVAGAFSRAGITVSDPGPDTLTGTVNFGDGTGNQRLSIDQSTRSFDLSHTYVVDGTYTVTVTVEDDDGGSTSDSFDVTAILNTPPLANDDSVSTDEDNAVTFNVLANDTDAQNNIVAGASVALTNPSAGTLTDNGNGSFSYDPNGAFDSLAVNESAQVSFDHQIEDAFGETDTGTVTITITGRNDAPVIANAGNVSVDEGQTASSSGTWSDIDASDVVALSASLGSVTKNANGTWNWTFAASDGPDESQTVVISVSDGNGGVATTSFDLTVNNVAPTANADLDSVFEDGAASVLALLDNDTDTAGANDPLTITNVNATGTTGAVSLSGGVVSYSPNGQFEFLAFGQTTTDSFSYTISDGDGGSDTATVSITIAGQNDAPTVANAVANVEVNQNAADTTIDISTVFADVDDGDTVTVTVTSSNGDVVTASVTDGILTLDYQPNQSGKVTITLTGTDSQDVSVTTTFEVTVLSPADQIEGISDVIQQLADNGQINNGQFNALTQKLAAALDEIESGTKNSNNTAVNKIRAFQNQVNAFVNSGTITSDEGDLLNGLADALAASLFA